jgi:membrane protein
VISIAGAALGRENVREQLVGQFEQLMGERAASAIETALSFSTPGEGGPVAHIFGLVAFGLGATAVFTQLQRSLNRMWSVEPSSGRPLGRIVLKRLLSLALVVAIGFLLLVSLVISAAVSGLQELFESRFRILAAALDSTNAVLSIAVFTLLFAVLYRFLPDVEIDWKDVWVGALVTAVLLTAGKSAIGMYVGRSALASTYGAAASVVVLLLWIYLSSLLILFGAVFTRVWCLRVRHHYPRPEEGARHARVPVEDGI